MIFVDTTVATETIVTVKALLKNRFHSSSQLARQLKNYSLFMLSTSSFCLFDSILALSCWLYQVELKDGEKGKGYDAKERGREKKAEVFKAIYYIMLYYEPLVSI